MSSDIIKKSSAGLIKTQLSMFSILPFKSTQEDVEGFCSRFWTVPVSGLIFGVILGLIFMAATYLFTVLPAAVITIFAGHILNRFLHFDGLMDFGDGLVAHGDHEKKVRALKDSNVGAGAVGVAIMVSILTIVLLSSCLSASAPGRFGAYFYWSLAALLFPICMETLAKNGLYTAAAFGKPAAGGLGEMFTASARVNDIAKSILISVIIVLPLTLLVMFDSYIAVGGAVLMVLLMISASVGTGYAVSRIAMKSFGFVNGDVLGAANELSKAAVLMAALLTMVVWL